MSILEVSVRSLHVLILITIRIRSNLYDGVDYSEPLLGVDKDFKKVKRLTRYY